MRTSSWIVDSASFQHTCRWYWRTGEMPSWQGSCTNVPINKADPLGCAWHHGIWTLEHGLKPSLMCNIRLKTTGTDLCQVNHVVILLQIASSTGGVALAENAICVTCSLTWLKPIIKLPIEWAIRQQKITEDLILPVMAATHCGRKTVAKTSARAKQRIWHYCWCPWRTNHVIYIYFEEGLWPKRRE